MENTNKWGLSEKELQQALAYMVSEGYMDPSDSTDDLINFTRSMVEGIPSMVTAKIKQWSSSYEQSQNL